MALLGDVKACVYMCRHTAFSSEAPQSARAGALLAIMCFGKDDIAHRAEEELASMLATIREKSAYEVAGHKADGSEVAGCEEIGDVAGCEAAGDVPGEASSEVGSDVANEVGSDPSNNPSNNPSSNVASDNAVSGDPSSNTASGDVSSLAFWLPGAYTAVEAKKSFAAGLRAWYSAFIQGFFSDALLVAACLFLREIKNATHSTPSAFDLELTSSKAYDEFLTFIYEQVNVCAHQKNVFMQALCLCMFEQARKRGYFNDAEPFTIEAIRSMQEAERLLASQRNAYAQNKALTCENKLDFEVTHPNIFREERRRPTQKSLVAVAPVLHVNLFGGLAVHIGDAQVDARLLRRSKARTLLALLVINKGKELARDGLVQTLWPESELATARKNFYSVWSQLRRALTTPAGTCPYLVRTQSGFHIDAHLLDSDLDHFEAMCRTLMFGHVRPEEWEHLFEQASSWYSGDFLPGENECARIQSMRTSCNERLVDALVSASTRLLSAGEVRGGLWFAREALRHDKTREDSYAALMEAQIAAGQRAAALETYFACRSYLADELGIDPSVHTVRLYRDIIEAEESFQW